MNSPTPHSLFAKWGWGSWRGEHELITVKPVLRDHPRCSGKRNNHGNEQKILFYYSTCMSDIRPL